MAAVQAPCDKRHFAADVGCGITVCVDGFAARQILSFDGIWRCASDTCPVFGQYERRKPQAREVVLLSTLTALCVVMNEICAHTIPLHAGTTMVVICGIGLGPEAGFLIGAMSRLVCNFLMVRGHGLLGRWLPGGWSDICPAWLSIK